MNLDQLFHDTLARRHDLPRRKADLQRVNLLGPNGPDVSEPGLIERYGAFTEDGVDDSIERIRQEVFRRPAVDMTGAFPLDTLVTGFMIDREQYDEAINPGANTIIALFRFFLEPLGVPVDKWSMSVRGRSRTYTFADVFSTYIVTIQTELEGSLPGPHDCPTLLTASNTQFTSLPAVNAIPAYTEVQRIFNRNCTECHGNFRNSAGMIHGPYKGSLDLSEGVSYPNLFPRFVTPNNLVESELFTRITSTGGSMMPPGGPLLSRTDIETIRRWIEGGATNP
jgi:mono/diheme cytochrome c family protein